jgi:hypothetical protein
MLYEAMGEWEAAVTETSTYVLGRRLTWGGSHESLDAGGHEPATQVEASAVCKSEYPRTSQKNTCTAAANFFPLGFPIFA